MSTPFTLSKRAQRARRRVLGLVLGGLLLAACDPPPPRGAADEKLPPQVSLYGVRLHHWEKGDLVAVGRAAKLTYDRASASFEAQESLMQFPSRTDTSATADMELRAPVTTGNLQSRMAEARGGLMLKSSSGMSGRTEAARFDGAGLVASGQSPVEVEGPGYSMFADGGFNFYFVTEELIFEGEVQSRLGAAEQAR